jgi:hypothetical protein
MVERLRIPRDGTSHTGPAMQHFTIMGIVALGFLPTAACSLFLNSDNLQCTSSSDCNTTGSASSFTCVDGICVSADVVDLCGAYIDATVSDPAVLRTIIRDTETQVVVPDITQKLCFTRDSICAEPKDTATSNAAGEAQLTFLREDARNLVLRTEPTSIYVRSTTYFSRLEAFAGSKSFSFDVGSRAYVDTAVLLVTGKPRDPTKAILVANVNDCLNNQGPTGAAGYTFQLVRLDEAPSENRFNYGANGFPSSSADRTSDDGWALLLNESPGFVSITATKADSGLVVAGPVSVELIAGEISAVWIVPQSQS